MPVRTRIQSDRTKQTMVTSARVGTRMKGRPRPGWRWTLKRLSNSTLSRLLSQLAEEMNIPKAALEAIASNVGEVEVGLRWQSARTRYLRQSIEYPAHHRKGCVCDWNVESRCLTLLRLACMTNPIESEPTDGSAAVAVGGDPGKPVGVVRLQFHLSQGCSSVLQWCGFSCAAQKIELVKIVVNALFSKRSAWCPIKM